MLTNSILPTNNPSTEQPSKQKDPTLPALPQPPAAKPDRTRSLELNEDTINPQLFRWKQVESLKFAMQVILTAAILALCIGKLTMSPNEDKPLYWGGITGLIAWWMPSPSSSQSSRSNSQTK